MNTAPNSEACAAFAAICDEFDTAERNRDRLNNAVRKLALGYLTEHPDVKPGELAGAFNEVGSRLWQTENRLSPPIAIDYPQAQSIRAPR